MRLPRRPVALFATLLGACGAEPAAFRPTEPTTSSRMGEPAAAYEVRDADGTVASVRVWSSGAHVDPQGRTVVDLGFEVQNLTPDPVRLDAGLVELEAFDRAGRPLPRPVPASPASSVEVPGTSAVDLGLAFVLPVAIAPAEIGSLRARWAVLHGDGRRYVQFTDFTRDAIAPAPTIAYVPVFGFYDPFFEGVVVVRHHVPVRRVVVRHRRPHHRR
jgi:hypothetical protein